MTNFSHTPFPDNSATTDYRAPAAPYAHFDPPAVAAPRSGWRTADVVLSWVITVWLGAASLGCSGIVLFGLMWASAECRPDDWCANDQTVGQVLLFAGVAIVVPVGVSLAGMLISRLCKWVMIWAPVVGVLMAAAWWDYGISLVK